MKIGFPQELLNLSWAESLIKHIDKEIPGIEWVHAPSAEGLHTKTLMLSEGDACFPFKKMIRSAVALFSEVDKLLVPRFVKLEGHLLCPNFRALPDIVALNCKRLHSENEQTPIIDTVVDISSQTDEKEVFDTIIKQLSEGVTKITPKKEAVQATSNMKILEEPQQSKKRVSSNKKTIALIGRSYIVKDPQLNMGIPDLLESYGYNVQTPQEIDFAELDKLATREDYFAKTLYWRGARECLGAFIHFTEHCKPAGIIYQLAFNCGVDALVRIELMSLHKKLNKNIPFMVLVGDEHTQREHIVTRLEAFLDVIDGITTN